MLSSAFLSWSIGAVNLLLFIIFPKQILGLFTTDKAVQSHSRSYLLIEYIGYEAFKKPCYGWISEKEIHLLKIELLSKANFNAESLDLYNRKQDVNKVYRRTDGEYTLVECKYTEDWDLNKKRSVAKRISSDEYITYIALENDKVIGFIGLLRQLNGPYMILDMMQVSSECRGQGVGRRLFEIGKAEARKNGAKALYISACSSEETIAFYRAMGSELASNPIKEIAEMEPFDLQMICSVKE